MAESDPLTDTRNGLDDGGRPVASGVPMLRLAADGVVLTRRVVMLD